MNKDVTRDSRSAGQPANNHEPAADKPLSPIAPAAVRYIKLGRGGRYEQSCIEGGTLRLGYHFIPHDAGLSRDQDLIRSHAAAFRKNPGAASRDARQVHDFYALGEDTLWITIIEDRLWWCFAEGKVTWVPAAKCHDETTAHRIRRCRTPWRSTDINGAPLNTGTLSGALTRLSAYRSSICNVAEEAYLLRRINGEFLPEIEAARGARDELLLQITALIKILHWRDFELLTELVFAESGWRRTGSTGGTQKTVDLELVLPVTGERAFAQVKSSTSQEQLDDYVERFEQRDETRLFFVYHSCDAPLVTSAPGCTVIGPERLAALTLDAGLTGWLIDKAN